MQTTEHASPAPLGHRPPDLVFAATGERFEFLTSAKAGDGVFRFRWTLQAGKKGPPEHVHDDESETFHVTSGTLRIWLDGVPRDLHAGESVTVERGVAHRFHNATDAPVVVEVSLDGPRQEDALVPLALRLGGSEKMGFGDFATMIVHANHVRASRPSSRAGEVIVGGIGRFFELFGTRALETAGPWS